MFLRVYCPETGQDEPAALSVAAVVEQYLAVMDARTRAGQLSPKAVESARLYCRSFAQDHPLQVSQCRQPDLMAWLALHPSWDSPHTQHNACGYVVRAFLWAVDAGLIGRTPYRKPKDLPACEPRAAASASEIRRILNAARGTGYGVTCVRFRLALWFLWETGCRPDEMYRLTWDMYDPEAGTFTLRSKTTRKTGRKRVIVLSRRAWRLVRVLRNACVTAAGAVLDCAKPVKPLGAGDAPGYAHVFRNARGRRWSSKQFNLHFRTHSAAAGCNPEISAYSTRHGFCSRALEAGCGERQVADLMGHSSTRLVEWYSRSLRSKVDYLRATAERVR